MAFTLPEGLAPEVYPLAWLVGAWRGEGVLSYPGIDDATFVQDVTFDHDGGPYLRYTSTIRVVTPTVPETLPADWTEETPSDAAADADDDAAASAAPSHDKPSHDKPSDDSSSDDVAAAEVTGSAAADTPDAEPDAEPTAAHTAPDDDVLPRAQADDPELRIWSTETGYWRVPPERPDGLPENKTPIEVLLADPAGRVTLYIGAIGNGRVDMVSDLIARTATAAEVTASNRLYGLVEGDLMWVWELAAFGHPLQSYASARLTRLDG